MRKAETIMAQADKDGDGVVSFDEFVIVSKKFPNILFPAYSLGKKHQKEYSHVQRNTLKLKYFVHDVYTN